MRCKPEFPFDGYVRRGLYAYQLAWWLCHFPAKQLLVLNHEEVGTNMHENEEIPMHTVTVTPPPLRLFLLDSSPPCPVTVTLP